MTGLFERGIKPSNSIKRRVYFDQLGIYQLLKKGSAPLSLLLHVRQVRNVTHLRSGNNVHVATAVHQLAGKNEVTVKVKLPLCLIN
jgi:hypothetical protein